MNSEEEIVKDLVESAHDERRVRILRVDVCFLTALLKQEQMWMRVVEGLPMDARVIGMGRKDLWAYNPEFNEITIVVWSSEYEPVPEGERIPEVKPVVMRAEKELPLR